jgi:hypothetical protein
LDQMIFFSEDSLRQAIHEFVIHYHRERNHQARKPVAHSSGEDCRPCGNYRPTAKVGWAAQLLSQDGGIDVRHSGQPITRYVEAAAVGR